MSQLQILNINEKKLKQKLEIPLRETNSLKSFCPIDQKTLRKNRGAPFATPTSSSSRVLLISTYKG
jgi:hypothetical protein